ncbi:L-alanine-DL-glutamate epimerase [candidate division KSB1 bacterium]|nr:MAG: L-alanine-DL-glutamate epimerase [candidate division KSB1 bacterium]
MGVKRVKIEDANSNFEREPLIRPFGFKGGYVSEVWQSVVCLKSTSGARGLGIGTQSVLWSDASVFASHTEAGGNALMFAVTEFALKLLRGTSFTSPVKLLEELLGEVHEYGKKITNNPDLRLTFTLNSLVAVDNALWMLFANENNITNFNDLIPEEYRPALSYRHKQLASIPLMTYGVPLNEIVKAVNDGYFFLKIKIGSDPDGDGDREKMLHWDMKRFEEIHKAIGDVRIEHTEDGKIPYYLDANGRYDSKERLQRFLDHAEKIGAFDQIAILEEPFPEEYEVDVSDLGVRIAADESAHSDTDVRKRTEMGYGAIALKPIAKTLSMSLKILKVAYQVNVPCFCADLTVIPILVDWNKNVAARIAPLPGMKIGVLETNGHQNYRRWNQLLRYHPHYGAEWMKTKQGLFHLDEDFYASSGGIFEISKHYRNLVGGC